MVLEQDELDEMEARRDQKEDKEEAHRLQHNKYFNYVLLRKLKLISDPRSIGALAFVEVFGDYFSYEKKIMEFQQWCSVEGGAIQVRESNDIVSDMYGYAVVRPEERPENEFFLRVENGNIMTVAILPRMDGHLPRQGKIKDLIIEKMQLVSWQQTQDYSEWLKRMKDVGCKK
jgi:hypothetical protein